MRLLILLTVLIAACAAEPDPAAPSAPAAAELPKPLHVAGRYLRDEQGRAVLLHGVNWVGNKLAPYGADVTEGEAAQIAALGMNHVRLITGWAAIMPEEGRIDRAYLKTLRRRAEWAAKYDLLVVADMHQDIYGEGIVSQDGWILGNGAPAWTCGGTVELLDPWMINYIQDTVAECYDRMYTDERLIEHFAEAHLAVIETLGDLPNFLGVEILNEPFIGTASPLRFDVEVLTPFYDAVYARIRAALGARLVFAEPSIVKNLAALGLLEQLPTEQAVYSPHLYDSRQELGTAYDGSTAYLEHRFTVDGHEADLLKAPLWIGEWGNPPDGDADARRYIADFLNLANATYTGRAFWAWESVPGRPAVAAALAQPYLERAPGQPVFSYAAGSRRLTLEIVGDGASETWVRTPKGARAAVKLEGAWLGQSTVREGGSTRFVLPAAAAGEAARAVLSFE